MYILLSGRPPFDGANDDDTLRKIKIGSFEMNIKELKSISKEGIDLLKKLLTYEPEKRISAADALQHPWIRRVRDETN